MSESREVLKKAHRRIPHHKIQNGEKRVFVRLRIEYLGEEENAWSMDEHDFWRPDKDASGSLCLVTWIRSEMHCTLRIYARFCINIIIH